ncbi:MAG: transposon-encoded TnpW family protein [Christensenellales bacterium]
MNEQKKPDTAATNPIPLTETETAPITLVKKIGNTIFDIRVHFSETSKETFTDKVLRLIRNDNETT